MKTTVEEIKDLKPPQVGAIKRMYESFGTGSDGVGRVAKAFHISESAAVAMATAVATKPAATVTESAPDATAAAALDADATRKATLAFRLHQQVNEAEARIERDGGSMAGLSIQQLQALGAAAAADAGMFG